MVTGLVTAGRALLRKNRCAPLAGMLNLMGSPVAVPPLTAAKGARGGGRAPAGGPGAGEGASSRRSSNSSSRGRAESGRLPRLPLAETLRTVRVPWVSHLRHEGKNMMRLFSVGIRVSPRGARSVVNGPRDPGGPAPKRPVAGG